MEKTFGDVVEDYAEFSAKTFGPGLHTVGLTRHIIKELDEIANADGIDPEEWVDVIILGIDGLIRCLSYGYDRSMLHRLPDDKRNWIIGILANYCLQEKIEKNKTRQWPDWRAVKNDEPIEHIKKYFDDLR